MKLVTEQGIIYYMGRRAFRELNERNDYQRKHKHYLISAIWFHATDDGVRKEMMEMVAEMQQQ